VSRKIKLSAKVWAIASAVVIVATTAVVATTLHTPMARLPGGDYVPFFQASAGKGKVGIASVPIRIAAFRMDIFPVTNGQFLDFVRQHPEWRRSRIKSVFADGQYLAKWRSDLTLPDARAAAEPVTNVSWFAAEAYCEARGLRLPTTEQWEYALADQGRNKKEIAQRSLEWFSTPNPDHPNAVGRGEPNGFGIYDLVGLVWEWTLDNNSFMTGTEQRNTSSKDDAAFCGSGSVGVSDASDYPTFMRYALRTSLKAAYTVENVGFRCEEDE
jgi:formylglycine-generating enzyme required for sulfatase activity